MITPLTPREVETLAQLALGKTNREIAHALGLKHSTVHTYVVTLRDKLGARTRTEAVMLAMVHGLLVQPVMSKGWVAADRTELCEK